MTIIVAKAKQREWPSLPHGLRAFLLSSDQVIPCLLSPLIDIPIKPKNLEISLHVARQFDAVNADADFVRDFFKQLTTNLSLEETNGAFSLVTRPKLKVGNIRMDADGVPCDESPLPPSELPSVFDNPLGNMHKLGSPIYLHRLVFRTTSGDILQLGVVAGAQLDTCSEQPFFGDTVLCAFHAAEIKELCWQGDDREAWLKECETFTRLVVQVLLNRKPILSQLFHYAVPLLDDDFEIDWQLLRAPLSPIANIEDVHPGLRIIVPSRRMETSRMLDVVSRRDDLTMQTPPLSINNPNAARRFADYAGFFLVTRDFKDVPSNDKLLEAKAVYLATAFPQKDLVPAEPSFHRDYHDILPLSVCRTSNLTPEFWILIQALPSWTRHLHDQARTKRAMRVLDLPENLDRNLIKRALTLPACGTTEDYESLETIASDLCRLLHVMLIIPDAGGCLSEGELSTMSSRNQVQKSQLATSRATRTDPEAPEGVLAQMREHSTNNATLKRRAMSLNLGTHIISERWRSQPWIPPSFEDCILVNSGSVLRRRIPQKAFCDCMESLLGAGWCDGGLKGALQVGAAIGLCFGGSEYWHLRPFPPRRVLPGRDFKSFEPLEKKLGYVFKDKTLLVEASCGVLESMPSTYERLEYLGDALVDMYVVAHFTARFRPQDITSEQISRLKVLCVSNGSLGYLAMERLQAHQHLIHTDPDFDRDFAMAEKQAAAIDISQWETSIWMWDPPKVVGDLVESIVAAVFVDLGYRLERLFKIMDKLYSGIIEKLGPRESVDPVSKLREVRELVGKGCRSLLVDVEQDETGITTANIVLHGTVISTFTHSTQSVAKQAAALKALHLISSGQATADCDCAQQRAAKPPKPKRPKRPVFEACCCSSRF